MHGNQWVLKIAVLKYYSVSKRGTTAKSNPKQATDPISLHTIFGDNSSNTFPLNEQKPCVTPDIGRRTAEKAKIIYPPPRGVDIMRYKAKTQNQLFYDPSLTHKGGGQGVKLTGYLDSLHMLSQYLLIYSEAIKATIKEI